MTYSKITAKGEEEVRSRDVKVGDIIKLKKGNRAPADLVLLYTTNEEGTVFIKTDQLDGETDWKVREAVKLTQEGVGDDPSKLVELKGYVQSNPPCRDIHKFKGYYTGEDETQEALRVKNTIWSHTVLATSEAYGIAVFVGSETRMKMNAKDPRNKVGRTDKEVDRISKYLFVFLAGLTATLFFLSGEVSSGDWYVHLIKYVILLSSIIPISLRVNVDFAKMVYSIRMSYDQRLEGTVVRNTAIPEELGRVEYLLSDKTGTMTKNEMIFKKISTIEGRYSAKKKEKIIECLKKASKDKTPDAKNLSAEDLLSEFVKCLMVCHNVAPSKKKKDNDERALQASSPDEVALVEFGEDLGWKLLSRDNKEMKISMGEDQERTYTILENFPFTSERKRMGIIVKEEDSGVIQFFLKGADSVIADLLDEKAASFIKEEGDEMASSGLRTLAMCFKQIEESEYEEWKQKYEEAGNDLENREKRENETIELLEKDLKLLGVTGVEDLLQEDIKTVIENLRAAGIRVWMLTGDKLETAKCIAVSTGLKSNNQEFLELVDAEEHEEFLKQVKSIKENQDQVVVIEGDKLQKILKDKQLRKAFIEYSSYASSVVCCRCAPFQKSEIATAIKMQTQKTICCIGDGGNDVAMIQKGDIGIGIEGKEGKQAALAADFSITEFKTLAPLILYTGRLSYKRTGLLANFVIHRGLVISLIQFIYTFVFDYTTRPIYNGYLMLGYATVFTAMPVFALTFDEDVSYKQVISYPLLYQELQKGRELSMPNFLVWVWVSIYQSGIIIGLPLMYYDMPFLKLVTVTFTALILVELLNVVSFVHRKHPVILISAAVSLGIYAIGLFLLKKTLILADVEGDMWVQILIITAAAWLPVKLLHLIKNWVLPSEAYKMGKHRHLENDPVFATMNNSHHDLQKQED